MKPRKCTSSERVPEMTFWYFFLCEAKHCSVNDPYPVEALNVARFVLFLWFGALLSSLFPLSTLQTTFLPRHLRLLFLSQWTTSQHCNILLLKIKNSERVGRFFWPSLNITLQLAVRMSPKTCNGKNVLCTQVSVVSPACCRPLGIRGAQLFLYCTRLALRYCL